jgi:hypothetical protein
MQVMENSFLLSLLPSLISAEVGSLLTMSNDDNDYEKKEKIKK